MKPILLHHLRCPEDGANLTLRTNEEIEDVLTGELLCLESAWHRYPVADGIPDFRSEAPDNVAEAEPDSYGTIPTQAVVHKVLGLHGSMSLDAGCAKGAYRPFLPGHYVGVDIVRPFLLEAKRKFPDADFVAADVLKMPFADKTFDIVFSSQVIEHVDEHLVELVLCEFRRLARNQIVIDTPNESRLLAYLRRKIYEGEPAGIHDARSPLGHHALLTPRILRQYGFVVEGCIGHVSRARFNWPRFWNIYDRIARIAPGIAGNLVATIKMNVGEESNSGATRTDPC